MPKQMHDALARQAAKHKGWSKEHKDKYVYGAMRRLGWVPSTQKKKKRK